MRELVCHDMELVTHPSLISLRCATITVGALAQLATRPRPVPLDTARVFTNVADPPVTPDTWKPALDVGALTALRSLQLGSRSIPDDLPWLLTSTLMRQLEQTLDEADAVLRRLRPEQLTDRLRVQSRDVTVLEAVYQVVQHFALHLGQIILITKGQVPGAIKFYEDAGGAARPIWR